MVIVKTNTEHRFGVKVSLPAVGTVTPNEVGEFEADEQAAQELILAVPDFFIKDGEEIKKDDENTILTQGEGENELTPPTEEEIKQSKQELETLEEAPSADEIKTTLEAKTKAELQELCKQFPSGEWRTKNKAELIDYLIGKMSLTK